MMLKSGIAAFTLACCALFSCADLTQPGKRYALVYGVAFYTTVPTDGQNLDYPDDDALAVFQMLNDQGYDEVRLEYRSTDNPTGTPSKANMETDMAYFASIIGQNDTFVFYFSGHGNIYDDTEYFVPYLGIDPGGTHAFSATSSVTPDELGTYLAAIPTARKIVILDSCFSGGFVGNPLEVDMTPPAYLDSHGIITPMVIAQAVENYAAFSSGAGAGGISPYGNAIVISAAGAEESSWEYGGSFNHGVATYFFLQAPQHGDLNGDGLVSTLEAFSLIQAGVDNEWNSSVSLSEIFAPHISGGPLDYVLF